MKDVMLDFETLGTGPNAAVVQIGACYFDRFTGAIGPTFSVNVTPESAAKSGADIDASTVVWWLSQSKEAQTAVFNCGGMDITEAFTDLNTFLKDAKNIWSHATFDFVILGQTLRRLKIKPNFRYSTGKDIRTLMDLAKHPSVDTREGIHHNAIDDCFFQVKYCVRAFNILRGTP